MSFDFYWPKNSLKDFESYQGIKNNNEKFDISNNCEAQNQKRSLLNTLKEKKRLDRSLIFANQDNNFVFDDGNIDSDIMFIGEAPGEEEDKLQKPFVGKSGQLLRLFLKEANIFDFYITNIVSWRPPYNRTPTNDEIACMKPFIIEHIKIIDPKIIVTVGTTALKALGVLSTITNTQGTLLKLDIGNVFPIYHPSYALRVSSKKKELWISLLKLYKISQSIIE
ncbi:uracil-DNA glycosylase [Alphaproteobacteria bacterium endosymbiont of Tiliacea citrago]|uniref:uracil-DNA glycosylase n=1 Tax=Alphaproteobacteria bacterium endosymbiont of Tiliacea citrago TaxID=3077944 RepID=UPI00313CF534